MHLLIENCALLTPDASQGYETGRYIAIKGNTIEAITDRRPDGDFDQVLSGYNRLAIPGLINAHTHSPENFMRGTAHWGQAYGLDIGGQSLLLAEALGYEADAVIGETHRSSAERILIQFNPGVLEARPAPGAG